MKYLIIAAFALFSASSFAWKGGKGDSMGMGKMMDSMSFEDAKKMAMEKMDNKMKMAEDGKKCVNDTKDKEGLKKCMNEMHEDKMEMKEEMREEMKDKAKKK